MQINPTQTVAGIENQVNAEATQQFIPQFNKLQTRSLANAYKANPNLYSQQQVESIKMHSQYHQVPFMKAILVLVKLLCSLVKDLQVGLLH